MRTYLIQRAKFENRDYKKGVDSILNLDYMGSAEFEFGALPKSLGNIRDQIGKYIYIDISSQLFGEGKIITVFCKESQEHEITEYLKNLANREIRLKEYSDFDSYVNPSQIDIKWQTKHPHKTDFWWDLDNDLMFWKKNPEFEDKFKKIIITKPI